LKFEILIRMTWLASSVHVYSHHMQHNNRFKCKYVLHLSLSLSSSALSMSMLKNTEFQQLWFIKLLQIRNPNQNDLACLIGPRLYTSHATQQPFQVQSLNTCGWKRLRCVILGTLKMHVNCCGYLIDQPLHFRSFLKRTLFIL